MTMESAYILGFDCYGHDAAAAIIKDGELVAFAEEERFTRRKHTAEYPLRAMRWCCQQAGIDPQDLNDIVYYWNPYMGLLPRVRHIARYFPVSLQLLRSRSNKFFPMMGIKRKTRQELNLKSKTKIHFSEHHLMHAYSSFCLSPFKKAAILSIDAVGEWATAWMGYGEGKEIKCLKRIDFPHSLGIVYGGLTEYLGFKFANGEGKVMGLAAYGDPEPYQEQFQNILRCTKDGGFSVDTDYFEYHLKGRPHWVSEKFLKIFGPARVPGSEFSQRHKDIAAALQQRTEEVCFHMADWLQRKTGLSHLCLGGGVSLNSVMNGKLLSRGPFEDVWIQPAANDAGTSIGACYWLWQTKYGRQSSFVMDHAYWGPEYGEEEIEKRLLAMGLEANKVDHPAQEAARLIAEGKIVGWFNGRMECGPRALGNRSILADPRRAEMKDILNSRVKFRESFRPFAPSVLEEKCGEYFDSVHPSPFMILVYKVKESMKDKIPAVIHVDGTVRVQTVSRKTNPAYYDLIQHFGRLTGVDCVLNTSFNIRGEPIVNTPEEAATCYLKTGMNALFLGNFFLQKNESS